MHRVLSGKMSRCRLAQRNIVVVVMAIFGHASSTYGISGVDQAGPYKIGHISFDAVDTARSDRTLPTEV
jgi:hypothetical protein